RPFRFVGLWLSRGWNVVVEWMENGCGAVLLWLRSSWTDEGERRTRERADEGKSRREEKSAAKLPRSFCPFPTIFQSLCHRAKMEEKGLLMQ
ncbi:MAG: hypothetical protein II840_09865, partial [Kiritimatiellae bacterium]|nr:hypothetical protein [Kiritimatiellia bacterium]